MERDFNGVNPYMDFPPQPTPDYAEPMFNPVSQYEQAYVYYKYLCMQMDYKIKCKEYEKICGNSVSKSTDKKPV